MDKVGYDMGIEMSYANQDKKVPEAYREKMVIKESFRIAYYRLP